MKTISIKESNILLLVFMLISFGLQVFFINMFDGIKLKGDQGHYYELIKEFYNGEGITTIYRPPGIVWFGGFIFKIFGPNLKIIFYIQAAINVFCISILDKIAKQLDYDRWSRNYICIVYALFPTCLLYSSLLLTEILFVFFFLNFIHLWLKAIDHEKIVYAILAGSMLGCASLVRPIAYLIIPFVAIAVYLYEKIILRIRTRKLFLLLLSFCTMIVVISPWTYRNYKLCHDLVLVSASGGEVFWSGNNKFTKGFYTQDIGLEGTNVNLNNYSILERKNPCFRIKFSKIAKREALDFIKNNPGRFITLTLKKLSYIFTPKRDYIFPIYFSDKVGSFIANIVPSLVNMILYMFGIAGLILSFDVNNQRGFFILAIVCYFLVVTTLTFYCARFMFPIIPFIILASSNCARKLIKFRYRWHNAKFGAKEKMVTCAWILFLVNASIGICKHLSLH
jgi:4-amino-4-deoxy-L-arabinose transferase-like glycosyltransferase